ncbi:MAG: carbamoyltransferase [Desulfobacterales bacterium]|nr:carbamoyltransferase [Desulfobacterales bacterium]
MADRILGLSAFYHDSAAVVHADGQIEAAAQEERFTRRKHDADFPVHAMAYVLKESHTDINDLTAVAFYDKPFLKFERLIETYHAFAPKGLTNYLAAIPVWIKEKLFMKSMIRQKLSEFGATEKINLLFPEHHLSHAASAFYPSPFNEAAILTIDGVGEWATTTISHGRRRKIEIRRQIDFPHSLGLLYSAFTAYCGFKVNGGEYKLMGLAPYGDPSSDQVRVWNKRVRDELIDLRPDGSFLLNMDYFDFATGLRMYCRDQWMRLIGIPPRKPESEIDQAYMNLALVIQQITEDVVLRLATEARRLTGAECLAMAGGVALNCVANGKVQKSGLFRDLWIQPAAGDAGGALGAAYAAWHLWQEKERRPPRGIDAMQGTYLGPSFPNEHVERAIRKYNAPHSKYDDFDALCQRVVDLLEQGRVVGWFQGRMEFGPRALGNRSILGDARRPEMQRKINLHIKYREGFRPFAPSVLEEDVSDYFKMDQSTPYMLLVAPVREDRRIPVPAEYARWPLYERLHFTRSDLPAITHVDFSARIQSVSRKTNPRYWQLLNTFKTRTGYGILVNTSFNVRGEPIVCTPAEAYLCFMRTEMDFLVINDYLFDKSQQPRLKTCSHASHEG